MQRYYLNFILQVGATIFLNISVLQKYWFENQNFSSQIFFFIQPMITIEGLNENNTFEN